MKNKHIYTSLLFLTVSLFASSLVYGQKSIRLKLKPDTKKEYKYHSEMVIGKEGRAVTTTSFTAQKTKNKAFLFQESIEELNVFTKNNEQVFSLNAFMEYGDRKHLFQQFIKSLKIEREMSEDGVVLKNFNVDSAFKASPYTQIGKFDRRFSRLFKSLQRNDLYFFLNRELKKGETFEYNREFSGRESFNMPITFTVHDINDKQTILFTKATFQSSIGKTDAVVKQEGIWIIENKTGLPIYGGEILQIDKLTILLSITRDDFKALSPTYEFRGGSKLSKPIDISEFGNVSRCFKNKKEAKKALEKLDVKGKLEKHGRRDTRLELASNDSSFQFFFKLNNATALYCNKEEAKVNSNSQGIFDLVTHDRYSTIPNVFVGNDCMVEKLTVDLDVIVPYGIKKKTLTKKDVGTFFTTNHFDFGLMEWEDSTVVMSYCFFKAFNAEGKQIKKASIGFALSQFKQLAKIIDVPLADFSKEKAWLYSPLVKGLHLTNYLKIKFEEPVAKIVLLDYKNSMVGKKTVEISNTEEVKEHLAKRTKRRLEREKRKEERAKAKAEKSKPVVKKKQKQTIDAGIPIVEEEEEPIFVIVEDMPEFIGGELAKKKFIQKNLKYPKQAKQEGIQGRVFVQFVIEKDGSVSEVKVVRGIHHLLDKEAVRVIKSMPKWKPGKQRGKAVHVRYTVPISFML